VSKDPVWAARNPYASAVFPVEELSARIPVPPPDTTTNNLAEVSVVVPSATFPLTTILPVVVLVVPSSVQLDAVRPEPFPLGMTLFVVNDVADWHVTVPSCLISRIADPDEHVPVTRDWVFAGSMPSGDVTEPLPFSVVSVLMPAPGCASAIAGNNTKMAMRIFFMRRL